MNANDTIRTNAQGLEAAKLAAQERLRDAAPDMLEALRALVDYIGDEWVGRFTGPQQLEQARAAIAKAAGEKL